MSANYVYIAAFLWNSKPRHRRPAAPSPLPQMRLNIPQMQTQSADRNLNFPNKERQGENEQQQGGAKHPNGQYGKFDVNQKHGQNAQQQTGNSENLHVARQVEAETQVPDLLNEVVVFLLLVLGVQIADHGGVRQKAVGVGQHDQGDGGE